MPSNIDFSQFRPDPNIFKADDEWVNRLYQYAAKRDAGQMYAGGDTAGAARRLAQSGDLAGATTLDAATTKAANDAQDQIIQNFDAQQKFMKSAAPLLTQGFASHGAEGLKQGWDSYVAPHMKLLGAKDDDIAKLGQMIQGNPGVLSQLVTRELVTEKLNNGDVLVLDKNTGDVVKTIKGTASAPAGYRTTETGLEAIPGGPDDPTVVEAKAAALRRGAPLAPRAASGGGTQAVKDDATLAQGKRDTPEYYTAWWRRKSTPRYAGTDPATGEAIFYEQNMAQWPEPTWNPASGGGPAAPTPDAPSDELPTPSQGDKPRGKRAQARYEAVKAGNPVFFDNKTGVEFIKGADGQSRGLDGQPYTPSDDVTQNWTPPQQSPAPQAASGTTQPSINITRVQARTPPPTAIEDPIIQSWVHRVRGGDATMAQIPLPIRNTVSKALDAVPEQGYSPIAASRFSTAANRILQNYIKLPQYALTAQGLPFLERIDAALKTPGSVSDADLLDSLVKLNTGGNAVTEAQVKLVTDGRSFGDSMNVFFNRLANGGVLSNNQRQQVATLAKQIYANYKRGYQPVYDEAVSKLKGAGIPQPFWSLPDLNKLGAAYENAANRGGGSGGLSPEEQRELEQLRKELGR